ncbi:MAG TPA: anti-sigma-D factor RsdA [Mycobacterium sp.]
MPDFGRWTSNGGDPSLNEINRTDRFLDALASEQPVYATDPGEAELINLLSGWRDEIRGTPLTVPVTPRDAVIALDSAQRTRRGSRRTLALVGSTAAAVLCLGGFASVVAGAGPGDSLYGLRTMIFGEQPAARDDAVVLAAQTQMAEVQQLIDQGQWDAAQAKLQTLTTTVATVNDDARKQELVTEWQELTVKVEAQDAAATLPPDAPPPVFPDVVVLDTPTSSDTTSPSEMTASAPETTSPSETTTSAPETTSPSETTTTSPSETTTSSPTSTPVDLPPPTSIPATTPPPTTQSPLPTPSGPLPTPSGPLPTPSAVTPLPTPTAATTLPTASVATQSPPVTTSVVEQQVEELQTAEEAPSVESPAQAPPIQQEAPKSVVTTTIEVPTPDADSGGQGG